MKPLKAWLKTPHYDDPDTQLRATMIHQLSVAVLVTILPITILLPIVETTYRYSLPLYITALICVAGIFVVLHTGHVRAAGALFAITGWAITLWASFGIGGVGSPQLSMAVLIIMLAGFLWSGKAAVWMAAAISLSLAGLEWARDLDLMPEPFIKATRFTVWAALSSVLALSGVLLQKFLDAMRAARDDAAEKAERLEKEMERRTKTEASLLRAEKLEALGRLTGGIAHDFNNILTVIVAESQLLEGSAKLGQPLTQEEHSQIVEIQDSANRAADLTRQLLAFSRQQAGIPKDVEPDVLIARLESMLKRLTREDVKLNISAGVRAARVYMDPSQFDQVIMNLVLNASDAMPKGGEMSITTTLEQVDEIEAELHPDARPGEFVVIRVRDTGKGIESEDLERIFDPFFTTKAVGRGTGLGLASVHGIVTQAGGHIRVESSSDGGTRFQIYLPVSTQVTVPDTPPAVAPVSERDDEHASPRASQDYAFEGPVEKSVLGTVLLCEDDTAVRRVTRRTLESAGHRVFEVASAEEALSWMHDNPTPIDLLVSDVILPGMNGVELAQMATQERPDTQVLLISGYTANVLEKSGVPLHAELLRKPFNPEVLLDKVSAHLRRARGDDGPS